MPKSQPNINKKDLNQLDTVSSPAKSRRSKRVRILQMRTMHQQIIQLPDGTHQEYKSSLLVDGRMVQQAARADFQSNLCHHFAANIPSHRPIERVTSFSMLGSPLGVVTPANKTVLKRMARFGSVSIFSNAEPASEPTAMRLDFENEPRLNDEFYSSPHYAAIKKTQDEIKLQSITVTAESLAETKQAYAKSGYTRSASQNQVMAVAPKKKKQASATEYVKATQLFSGNTRWEWLHLVAYAIGGPDTQNPANLVAGSQHANTDMMFAENQMEFLAKRYPKGFNLEIKADLIKGTHIAKKITYTIKTDDFTLPFEFDAQTTSKPHSCYSDYIRAFIEEFVDSKQKTEKYIARKAASSLMFFDRPEQQAAQPEEKVSRKRKRE